MLSFMALWIYTTEHSIAQDCYNFIKTPFKVFVIFPKLYVRGSARELDENESHYRPPMP